MKLATPHTKVWAEIKRPPTPTPEDCLGACLFRYDSSARISLQQVRRDLIEIWWQLLYLGDTLTKHRRQVVHKQTNTNTLGS